MSRSLLILFLFVFGCSESVAPIEPASGAGGKADDGAGVPRGGPVADYAPLQGVRSHALLRDLAPEFSAALVGLGSGHQTDTTGFDGSGYSRGTSLVWSRDYRPIHVRNPTGDLEVVAYLSRHEQRSGFTGSSYVPVAPPAPDSLFYRALEGTGGRWLPTRTLPIVLEHGNLVFTGRRAITTDRTLRQNAMAHPERHLRREGYAPRSDEETVAILAEGLYIAPEDVVVLPPMPGEKTEHIDLYVMALDAGRVLLPELRDDLLSMLTFGHEIELAGRVQRFLDEQAATLEREGLQVVRLPMVAPVYLVEADTPGGWFGSFYSPTNALIVDVRGERIAYLPTFDPEGFPEAYRALNESYQEEWARFFEGEGYMPMLVDSTDLGRAYGLFRCVTAIVPE